MERSWNSQGNVQATETSFLLITVNESLHKNCLSVISPQNQKQKEEIMWCVKKMKTLKTAFAFVFSKQNIGLGVKMTSDSHIMFHLCFNVYYNQSRTEIRVEKTKIHI